MTHQYSFTIHPSNRPALDLLTMIVVMVLAVTQGSALADPLDYERDVITLELADSAVDAAFFFEKTGQPKGGVILAYSQTPQPFYLNNIGFVLAQHGWSTLLVGTGTTDMMKAEVDDRRENSNEEPRGLSAILDQGVRFMQQDKGQYNLVLLAQGPIWNEVNEYISNNATRENSIQGLILLDIKGDSGLETFPIDMPVLDLGTRRLSDRGFQQRRIEANRHNLTAYTSVKLPSRLTLTTLQEDHLAKRMRGWLNLHIQGMVVDKALMVNK